MESSDKPRDEPSDPTSAPRESESHPTAKDSSQAKPSVEVTGYRGGAIFRPWLFPFVWIVTAVSLGLVISYLYPPLYTASSLIRIERSNARSFGPSARPNSRAAVPIQMQTQVSLIKSAKVLNAAFVRPGVATLPAITGSHDRVSQLSDRLDVRAVPETNLIMVSLRLPDRAQAIAIVDAVVSSYMEQLRVVDKLASRELMDELETQVQTARAERDAVRQSLKEQHAQEMAVGSRPRDGFDPRSETDPTKPTFSRVSRDQLAKMKDTQSRLDLEYLEAVARLEAYRTVRERNFDKINAEIEALVSEELRTDPALAALSAEIDKIRHQSRPATGPPADDAQTVKVIETLSQRYDALRSERRPAIRKRLVVQNQGLLSEAKSQELELAAESARRKKEMFAQQFDKIAVDDNASEKLDRGDAAIAERRIDDLLKREETLKRNIEQLKFETSQAPWLAELVDPAAAPKMPTNRVERLTFMVIAQVSNLMLLVSAMLLLGRRSKRGRAAHFPTT